MGLNVERINDAEQAVLGGLMNDNRVLWSLGDLEPTDFEVELNALLFHAIRAEITAGRQVDAVTAMDIAPNHEAWTYLCNLASDFPSLANMPAYADMVRTSGRTRRLRQVMSQAGSVLDKSGVADAEDYLLGHLLNVSRGIRPDASLDEAHAAGLERPDRGLSTTIPSLNAALNGLQPGRLYVLAARPGGYKSALALQIAIRAAKDGTPSGYISREMPVSELGERASKSGQYEAGLPMRVDDSSASIDQVTSRVRQWHHQHGIGVVVVDYIQLIGGHGTSRQQEIGSITRRLKSLAIDLNIPVLALSQLNRASETDNREPRMSDLREAGDIEQDADVVMFIHRVRAEDPADDQYSFLLAKNRGGRARIGSIPARVEGFRIMEAV